jgi:3-phenylpropionate/trans-cinnamate dioxygenase ferredoxin reductase subunit
MHRTVIVGAGQGGIQTAASLRQLGYEGEIVLLGAEAHLPYQLPPLSKAYLKGETDEGRLPFRPKEWFETNAIDLRLGEPVIGFDLENKKIDLTGRRSLSFDALVLATGSRARPLSVPGAERSGVLQIRTLDDARVLKSALGAAKRAVVVGGGYIGLEVAATAKAEGVEVTVVDLADRLLSRVASAPLAAFMKAQHERRGVRFALGVEVERIDSDSGHLVVAAKDGRRFEADLVIAGVGAQPEISLASDAGIHCERGICVDERGHTSVADVYAVGDCTVRACKDTGVWYGLESVQNAIEQAKAVAAEIAGVPPKGEDVPWFWSDQFDMKLQMAGRPAPGARLFVEADEEASTYLEEQTVDGRLVAAATVNRPADFMAARKLIAQGVSFEHEEGTPLSLVAEMKKAR